MKIAVFLILMLFYPLVLRWLNIHDYRVVPLIVPYALGVLSITVMLTGIAEFIYKKFKKEQ